MRWLLVLLLAGCSVQEYSLEGKEVTYVYHKEAAVLEWFCGPADACVHMSGDECVIHLPERARPSMIVHEEKHCAGVPVYDGKLNH